MWTRQHKKRNSGKLIVPALTALFLSYFGYHAFNGEFGIYAKYRLEERTAEMQKVLAETTARRLALEERVALMRDGTLEKDMLDEQARRALNVSAADEITIMRPFGSDN
ncbi:septum formation initiator family protein [Nitratireductor sp. CAU 1489]|uniref:Septum formation initiator family protein n=1 Tax=Nitratireductor arenosus TaxID=2682096 RepID=A0A844QGG6_9HYPH|nr:septum formation initiator family protein [Nitratireductor arenosus]MVA97714.1 septum formation initiator family protein [Nitratireductor arenosus]